MNHAIEWDWGVIAGVMLITVVMVVLLLLESSRAANARLAQMVADIAAAKEADELRQKADEKRRAYYQQQAREDRIRRKERAMLAQVESEIAKAGLADQEIMLKTLGNPVYKDGNGNIRLSSEYFRSSDVYLPRAEIVPAIVTSKE